MCGTMLTVRESILLHHHEQMKQPRIGLLRPKVRVLQKETVYRSLKNQCSKQAAEHEASPEAL